MIINLLVAASRNNAIGKDNKLLWHLPNDLAFFKNLTWGMPVIMGRKTYDSMGKPLRGRLNIVISRRAGDAEVSDGNGVVKTGSLDEALRVADRTDARECFVIGGGEIFSLALPGASKIYLTRVNATLEGDAFFPQIDPQQWELISSSPFEADDRHLYPYTFELWQRKNAS